MSHELSIRADGTVEFACANRPAWHNLGTVLPTAPDSETMIKEAHLDWQVFPDPVYVPGMKGTFDKVPDVVANRRSDTGLVLGIVSDRYKIVQNVEAFNFLDGLLQDGIMRFESAGALRGGRQVFALARMPSVQYDVADGDTLLNYILFSTSHSGDSSLYATPTTVRVVCANTHRQATKDLKGLRHMGNIVQKLETAKKYLSQFDEAFTLFRDKARVLATKPMTEAQQEEYVNTLFPPVDKDGRGKTIRDNKVEQLKKIGIANMNIVPAIANTYWKSYNDFSELVDHHGTWRAAGINEDDTAAADNARRENRMLSVMTGPAAQAKNEAFDLACQMAGV